MIGHRALDDPRNSLVYHFVRLVVDLKASYFVFENVKGLTIGEHRRFLEEIIQEFRKNDYKVVEDYQVLNAAEYGVPQDRKRLFLLGARRGFALPAYPEATHSAAKESLFASQTPTVWDALRDLPEADDYDELLERDWVKAKFKKPTEYSAVSQQSRSVFSSLVLQPIERSHILTRARGDRRTFSGEQGMSCRLLRAAFTAGVVDSHKMDAQAMSHAQRTYLPAAGHDWALPLYDPFVKLLGAETAKAALLDRAGLQPKHRVLDIGCGTGTLATRIKQLHPDVTVAGLDPDPKALLRARRKAQRAGTSVQFDQGFSDDLPYASGSFDRVFSSLMFHHLPTDQKEKTLHEVRRVLAPGGSLHLLDFDRPEQPSRCGLADRIHSSKHLRDNSESQILRLMQQAGLVGAKKVMAGTMLFGLLHIGYYEASAPVLPDNPVPKTES